MQYLVLEEGISIHSTCTDCGGKPIDVAYQFLDDEHPIIELLQRWHNEEQERVEQGENVETEEEVDESDEENELLEVDEFVDNEEPEL